MYPKKIVAVIFICAITLSAFHLHAQVVFKEPSFLEKTNYSMSIQKITVTPTRIAFELLYDGGKAWKLIKNSNLYSFKGKPYLFIHNYGHFSLSDGSRPPGEGAIAYDQHYGPDVATKGIKSRILNAVFPFNAGKMIFQAKNNMYTTTGNYLVMDFAECVAGRPLKPYMESCMNFKGVVLSFTDQQMHHLDQLNFIAGEITKKEFETTANYQVRTSKDSILRGMMKRFDQLEEVFHVQFRKRFNDAKPQLSYNADKQQFTIHHAGVGTDPLVIEVPLDKAPDFKRNVESGVLKPSISKMSRKADKGFYISTIEYYGKNGTQSYQNLNLKGKSEDGKTILFREVLKDLAPAYPKESPWAELK